MATEQPFSPSYGSGVSVSPGVASAASAVGYGNKNLVLTNTGANICYVHVGYVGEVASTVDMPVVAGTQITITKPQEATHVAYISAAGTTLNIMPGEGWLS
jgi:hypothetical protein